MSQQKEFQDIYHPSVFDTALLLEFQCLPSPSVSTVFYPYFNYSVKLILVEARGANGWGFRRSEPSELFLFRFQTWRKKPISQADLQQRSDKNHIWAFFFCSKSQLLLDKPHLKSCNFSATIKRDKIPVLFSPEPVISVRSDYKYYSSQTWYGLIRSCYVPPDYFSLFLVKFCCKTLHIASPQRKLFCQSGYFL